MIACFLSACHLLLSSPWRGLLLLLLLLLLHSLVLD